MSRAERSLDEIVYSSRPFQRWDERASVRSKPRRLWREADGAAELKYFPPELVAIARHPTVEALGAGAVERLLMQYLHLYLDFTSELEMTAVNPTCARISRGRCGLRLPPAMREDAHKIYTDEAWHAQFSDGMRRQIVRASGISPVLPHTHAFVERLSAYATAHPAEDEVLDALFFTIVSETLISSILSDIPGDPRVFPAVREIVRDHAVDEGVHHAFFANVLDIAWHQLTARERSAVAVRLPTFIRAFLDPDLAALAAILYDIGLEADDVGQIISDSYPRGELDRAARRDGRATLRHLERVGVTDLPEAVEALAEAGLG